MVAIGGCLFLLSEVPLYQVVEAAVLWKTNRPKFNEVARQWTKRYAT